MKSKVIPIILAACVAAGAAVCNAPMSLAQEVSVIYDGKAVDTDAAARIVDGHTMIPMRAVFEAFGAYIKWDSATQTVCARKGSKTVTMTVGSLNATLDKGKLNEDGSKKLESIRLEAAPFIAEGRTFVPLRAVSEAFGYDVEWSGDTYTASILSDPDDDTWKNNIGTIDLSTMTVTGEGATAQDKTVTITGGGDFTVTGTAECSIVVNTKDRVKLRLCGASITSSGVPAIYFESADKAFITLSQGTENTVSVNGCDSGAIRSKDKLEIKGSGSLSINNSTGHGIKAGDDLIIEDGTIKINAEGDGINVNDTFKMSGGSLDITAKGDGVSSDSIVDISGGSIKIAAIGNADDDTASSKGIKADWLLDISGGDIEIDSADHAIHCTDDIEIGGGSFTLASAKKGIAAHGSVTVGGEDTCINILRSTEGIEGKKALTVNDGSIKINASDDGVNAGTATEGGFFGRGGFGMARPEKNMSRQGEMMRPEGEPPQGEMARPDGEPSQNGMMRPDGEPSQNGMMRPEGEPPLESGDRSTPCIIINGGNLEISAGNDCLDANGAMALNGGNIFAVRTKPGNNMDGIFDTIGSLSVGSGATIVAAANASELQSVNENALNSLFIYLDKSYAGGSEISVSDKNGEKLFSYSPNSVFMSVYITSHRLTLGEEYTLTVGGDSSAITLSDKNTTVGTPSQSFGGRGNRRGLPQDNEKMNEM